MVDHVIQVDESGAKEQLSETHNVQQQDGVVSKEAEDDVLELKDREETLSSTPTQDISENVQLDDEPPQPLPATDCDSELREINNTSSSTSVARHVSLYMHIKV